MTQLVLTLSNYLQRPISEIVSVIIRLSDSFMESKVMKAWEEAARKKAQYYEARYTISELSKLTDKELDDIGISRGEIRDIAYSGSRHR